MQKRSAGELWRPRSAPSVRSILTQWAQSTIWKFALRRETFVAFCSCLKIFRRWSLWIETEVSAMPQQKKSHPAVDYHLASILPWVFESELDGIRHGYVWKLDIPTREAFSLGRWWEYHWKRRYHVIFQTNSHIFKCSFPVVKVGNILERFGGRQIWSGELELGIEFPTAW